MKTTRQSEQGTMTTGPSCADDKTANKSRDSDIKNESGGTVLYSVDSCPPTSIVFFYAIQQVVSTLGGPVTAAFVLSSTICAENDQHLVSQLIATAVFMSGFCTFIQVTFGLRLPILQGSSFLFVSVVVSMASTPEWKCPSSVTTYTSNGTSLMEIVNSTVDARNIWKPRLLEASGALIAASSVQVLLGCCGLIGFMMRYIGPLTIAVTIIHVGLSLASVIVDSCRHQWGVAIFTISVFLIVFTFLKDVLVPCPSWKKGKGFSIQRYPLFRLFPQLIAISCGWIFCAILTAANVLPETPDIIGYKARTDTHTELITQMQWFFLPYPFRYGVPTIGLATFSGMLVAVICSTIESIGDYYATARACGVPPPPKHAMNRGIAMEGFGGVVCGLVGSGHSTTSYSETIGFISLTGMTSRTTWQVAGCLFMVFGMFGKFSALLASIPDPVVGALLMIGLGMVVSVGLSNLQFVDLSSGRNHIILGLSILVGFSVSLYVKSNADAVNTGNRNIDQFFTVLLSNGVILGGSLAFALDNLLTGTQEERGFVKFNEESKTSDNDNNNTETSTYNLPSMTSPIRCISAEAEDPKEIDWDVNSSFYRFLTYLPFLPCYVDRPFTLFQRRKRNSQTNIDEKLNTTPTVRVTVV